MQGALAADGEMSFYVFMFLSAALGWAPVPVPSLPQGEQWLPLDALSYFFTLYLQHPFNKAAPSQDQSFPNTF